MAVSARLPYGSLARMTGKFQDSANAYIDPTAVFVTWTDPQGNRTTWQYGVTGSIVKDATGRYHADTDTTAVASTGGPGTWRGRWYSTGTGQGSLDFQFLVDDSPLK